MTGQTLLDTCEVLNQELQLQTSEADVVRGLIALNRAQDYFESLASKEGQILGDQTTTVVTATNVETTTFPAGFLRVDRIQYIDPTTNRPAWDLDPISKVGGHAPNLRWPYNLFLSPSAGSIPSAYYTNG